MKEGFIVCVLLVSIASAFDKGVGRAVITSISPLSESTHLGETATGSLAGTSYSVSDCIAPTLFDRERKI